MGKTIGFMTDADFRRKRTDPRSKRALQQEAQLREYETTVVYRDMHRNENWWDRKTPDVYISREWWMPEGD